MPYVHPDDKGKLIRWDELSLDEQATFLRLGYKPPEGTILHNNLGMIDDIDQTDPDTS